MGRQRGRQQGGRCGEGRGSSCILPNAAIICWSALRCSRSARSGLPPPAAAATEARLPALPPLPLPLPTTTRAPACCLDVSAA